MGRLFNRHRVSAWEDKKLLEKDVGDSCATCECT